MRGDRIRLAREALSLTQEDLAERANTNQLQIYRYESGRFTPKADDLARLATALHVSSDWLLGLAEEPYGHATDDLNEHEQIIIEAVRRGDKVEAIKAIVNG